MATALDLYLGPLLGGLVSWSLKENVTSFRLMGKEYELDVSIAAGVTVLTVILGLAGFPRAALFVGWTALLVSRMSIAKRATLVGEVSQAVKAADAKAIAKGSKPLGLPGPPISIIISYVLVHALGVAYGGLGLFGYQRSALTLPVAACGLAWWTDYAGAEWVINKVLGPIMLATISQAMSGKPPTQPTTTQVAST